MSDPERIPTYANYPEGFPPKFVLFHDRNPWVYAAIVRKARALRARGYGQLGIKYLLEDVRYDEDLAKERAALDPASVSSRVEVALDNNLAPCYGRLITATEPDLRGIFRLRRCQLDEEYTEVLAGQQQMEFE